MARLPLYIGGSFVLSTLLCRFFLAQPESLKDSPPTYIHPTEQKGRKGRYTSRGTRLKSAGLTHWRGKGVYRDRLYQLEHSGGGGFHLMHLPRLGLIGGGIPTSLIPDGEDARDYGML